MKYPNIIPVIPIYWYKIKAKIMVQIDLSILCQDKFPYFFWLLIPAIIKAKKAWPIDRMLTAKLWYSKKVIPAVILDAIKTTKRDTGKIFSFFAP